MPLPLALLSYTSLLPYTSPQFQNRFCTYRQSRDWIEKYCREFLSDEGLAMLMGGTAAKLLGVREQVEAAMAGGAPPAPRPTPAAGGGARGKL